MLRKWLAVGIGLALALMLGQGPAGAAGGGLVTGVISNWYQVKNKVSGKAYFQLVQNVHMKSANTDKDGLQALKSDLPRVSVRSTGGFRSTLTRSRRGNISLPCSGACLRPPSW